MSETARSDQSLFRKEALDRLRTPEQVDRLMHVVGPTGWVLLLSLAFVLGCAVYWSVAGRIATYVEGRGILGPAFGERREVVAPAAGILRQVLVKTGDTVKSGQLLAKVEMLDASEMQQDAQRTLKSIENERARQAAFWTSFIATQTSDFAAQKASLQSQITWAQQQIDGRQQILNSLTDLQSRGLATEIQVESARDDLISASASLDGAKVQLQQLQAKQLDLENQRMTAMSGFDDRILQAQEQLANARLRLDQGGRILADMDGVVVERDGQIDAAVQPGSPILAIQAQRTDLEGVFFAEPLHGKDIRVGMAANVAPSTAQPERYGTIRAKVVWVSPQPQSMSAVNLQLGNATLAQSLVGDTPPISFGVVLERDPSTPSGFAWTSGKGPPTAIETGTLATANVAIREDAPAVLVIPALRRLAGLDQ